MDMSVAKHQITRVDSVIESDKAFAGSPAPTEDVALRESECKAPDHLSVDRQAPSILAPPGDEDGETEMTNRRKRKRTVSSEMQIDPVVRAQTLALEAWEAEDFSESCGMAKENAQRQSAEETEHEPPAPQSTDPSTLHSSEAGEAGTKSPFNRKRSKTPERQIDLLAQTEITHEDTEENIKPDIAKLLASISKVEKKEVPDLAAQNGDTIQSTPSRSQSPLPTLAEEAFSAMKLGNCPKTRRVHMRQGDVLVVLDANNLGLSCRIRSEDLKKASVWFAESLRSASTSNGPDAIRYLYLLRASPHNEEAPQVVLTDLAVMKHACAAEIYTRPTQEQDSRSAKSPTKGVKEPGQEEHGAAAHIIRSDTKQSPDWLRAYETFFRTISHIAPKHLQFNRKDINDAIPHIKAVSMLASSYRATSYSSAITSAFTVLFAGFDERNMLLGSIAGNALQWLIIGTNLEKAAIFKEAFVHAVCDYPSICGEAGEHQLPRHVRTQVSQRAKEMQYRLIQVNNDLLSLSMFPSAGITADSSAVSPSTDYLAYSVLVYFKEWIAEHMRYHSHGGSGQSTSAFCDHSNGDCVMAADFYRLLATAGDYLPDTQVFEFLTRAPCDRGDNARELGSSKKETVRNILKTLKTKAANIVKPIVASTLCWTGSASLPYLTSLEVESDDYPWEPEIKQKDSIADSEESEDEDMD